VLERQVLADTAPHGDTDDMRSGNPQRVEQADRIRDEVRAVVPGSSRLVADHCPVSRTSYLITNLGPEARSSQNSSSHQSIELSAPPISRVAGSPDSPKVSTQRSTPFAETNFGRERCTSRAAAV